jgi:hypothetical protein
MKFGKSYMETLANPSFPQEWREGAIEYKQLKKLINGVVAELESLGLGADVLRDLMVPPEEKTEEKVTPDNGHTTVTQESDREAADQMEQLDLDDLSTSPADVKHHHQSHSSERASSSDRGVSSGAEDCELCAHSFLQHKAEQASNPTSPAVQWVSSISHAQHSRSRGRRRPSRQSNTIGSLPGSLKKDNGFLHPPSTSYNGDSDEASDILLLGSHEASSADEGFAKHYKGIGRKDLEQLRKANHLESPTMKKDVPLGSSPGSDSDRIHDWGGHAWRERAAVAPSTSNGNTSKKGKWVQGKGGRRARAEYELGGTQEHPLPRIRLFVESPIHSDEETTPGDEADSEGGFDDGGEDDDDDDRIQEIPSSPSSTTGTVRPVQGQAQSPIIWAKEHDGEREMRRREIVIPLTADTEFLDTLTGALANLSTLQSTQRENFIQSTESLCKSVARVSSPYANQNDLYVWREIFSLWCEFQIFESQREKDRGELSVDESEARLKRFAEEMARRGWTAEAFEHDGKNKIGGRLGKLRRPKSSQNGTSSLPMKDRQSVNALEDFLKLNLALLDVKKFQRVNVEAARKILKKHDKRTALTASSDYRQFIAEQERARMTAAAAAGIGISGLVKLPSDALGDASASTALVTAHGSTHPSLAALLPTSTTGLLSESLPHILLSLLTTTLLPILPSIDDYSCAICTGVAWSPIQLDCSHLFCIRCLVKLQKRGKVDCPLCRAKGVVGSADGRNLNEATVEFIKAWFPKEVAEKNKENESDRRKEEMQELGLALDTDKCIVV